MEDSASILASTFSHQNWESKINGHSLYNIGFIAGMTPRDIIWDDMTLHCTTFHWITLHYIALHHIVLPCIAALYYQHHMPSYNRTLHYIALQCFMSHYTTLHRITGLHYIACSTLYAIFFSECIALYCIALHGTTLPELNKRSKKILWLQKLTAYHGSLS